LNIDHNTDTNAIGQSQPSGVNIHGNKYEVTVCEGQNGQIGADGSGGHAESGILPRCVVLCGYIHSSYNLAFSKMVEGQ
jgi:hypothetical protein